MRKALLILAAVFAGMILLLLALVAASYAFNFQIPWVHLGVAWVMTVVPTSLFVIATTTHHIKRK